MAIKLEKVTYGNILRDISYEFDDGKIYTVISSSDIEKDAFSRLLVGKIHNYRGKIINDYDAVKIGYVPFNGYDMFVCDSVIDMLMLPISKGNYDSENVQKRVDFIFKILGLDESIKYLNPNSISDSEKRFLLIGLMLMSNPKVLVLNEPTLGLDDGSKKMLIKLFKKLSKDYNKTIIVLSSDVLFSYDLCDRYILLKRGKVIKSDVKSDLPFISDKLSSASIRVPKIIDFINETNKKKGVCLGMTFDIKELMKDIYRNVK